MWRVPSGGNYPPELWGKTTEEVLALAGNAAKMTNPPAPAPAMPTDETWIAQPGKAAEDFGKAFQANLDARYAPVLQGMTQLHRVAAQQQYPDEFKKWGGEIDALMAPIPVEQRNLALYERAVKLVRGEHQNEILEAKVQERLATMGALTERPNGSGNGVMTSTSAFQPEQLPTGFKEALAKENVTESQVRSFCEKVGWSLEQWTEAAKNETMFTADAVNKGAVTMPFSALGVDPKKVRVW